METDRLLTVWSDSQALSLLVWAVLTIAVLYLARRPAHRVIVMTARLLWRQARLMSRRMQRLAGTLARRSRSALLSQAREAQRRRIANNMRRLATAVDRDLGTFPLLQQQLADQIHRIDHDYRHATEQPPQPPEWLDAVGSVAALRQRDESAVGRILEDMQGTLDRAAHEAVLEYRAAARRRHGLLARMQPYWRRVEHALSRLDRSISHLRSRAANLDRQITRYEKICEGSVQVVRELANGAALRTLIAGSILSLITVGGVIGHELLARPLAEVGMGSGSLAGIAFHDVLAGALLVVALLSGALLFTAARISHLFPGIAVLDDPARRGLALASALMLAALAVTAAGLAWTRDYLLTQEGAVRDLLLRGDALPPGAEFHWVPALAHAVLAVALLGTMATASLPLESLLRNGRLLLLGLATLVTRTVAALFTLLAALVLNGGQLLIRVYDLVVFLPLAADRAVSQSMLPRRAQQPAAVPRSSATGGGKGPVTGKEDRSETA